MTDDPNVAAAEVAAGRRVVLVQPEGDSGAGAVPGQIAVLVGDITDPRVRAVADEMAAELYGR